MADVEKTIRIKVEAAVGNAVKDLKGVATETKNIASGANEVGGAMSTASVAVGAFTGALAADVVKAFAEAIGEVISKVIDLGAQTQQTISKISAMKNYIGDATEAYQYFNDVGRNTNYDLNAVQEMGAQLLNMGYSAKNAADLIQLCADTAAGLNQGQAGAQQLVDTLSRIQSTGEMSSRQLISLQMAGMDLDKAFSSVGMSAEQAMKAMDDGTLDAQTAIKALTDYMHEFDGAMAKSKDNITDQWGDVKGNIETICGEIGASIFDAFNQSEIVQTLIDFTQDLIDLVRSDGTGAFDDFKAVAEVCLDAINTGLKIVITAVKAVILGAQKMYAAFKSIGAKIASALAPILSPLAKIWNLVKSILSALGQEVSAAVDNAWAESFPVAERRSANEENHFRTVKREGKAEKTKTARSGGARSAAHKITDEERAIDALIKKYYQSDKALQNVIKSEIDLAKVNISMMTGDAKILAEKDVKLKALNSTHDELIKGYNDELALAAKIGDDSIRSKVIDDINKQITAENNLYKAKKKAIDFESNIKLEKKESANILDKYFGTQDEVERKIRYIKDSVTSIFEIADHINAGGQGVISEKDKSFIAKLLEMTPDALQEELDAKNETLAQFIDENKERIAEASKVLIDNENAAKHWQDVTVRYATMVGDAMADAMMDWITGAKTGKEALADFVSGILKTAAQLLTRWLSLFAIFSIVGDPRLAARNASAAVFGAYDGKIKLKAGGGYITGPGTATSDSIPAMLSNGEYVLRASAVKRIGVPTLNALNTGAYHFAEGGYVGSKKLEPAAMGGNLTLQVNALDASDFDNFLNLRGGGERIQSMLYEAQRRFAFSMED